MPATVINDNILVFMIVYCLLRFITAIVHTG